MLYPTNLAVAVTPRGSFSLHGFEVSYHAQDTAYRTPIPKTLVEEHQKAAGCWVDLHPTKTKGTQEKRT
jgi:hypothetical protein